MVRGKTWFKCPNCGHVFKGLDLELNATIESVPMPCPKCGTKSPRYNRPSELIGLIGSVLLVAAAGKVIGAMSKDDAEKSTHSK